ESPFASWMDRLVVDRPGSDGITLPATDPQLALAAAKGQEHERAVLEALRSAGKDICRIEPDGRDPFAATASALRSGREVIYQAALRWVPFAGYADFLVRNEAGLYEPIDTKLARKPKPYFLIQLCAYAEMLEAAQGCRPASIAIITGNGETVR